jgi:hypothetical protein
VSPRFAATCPEQLWAIRCPLVSHKNLTMSDNRYNESDSFPVLKNGRRLGQVSFWIMAACRQLIIAALCVLKVVREKRGVS